jgi:hypothetical protein
MPTICRDGEVCLAVKTDVMEVIIHSGIYEYTQVQNPRHRPTTAEIIWSIEKPPFDLLMDFLLTSAEVYKRYRSEVTSWVVHNTTTGDTYTKYPKQEVASAISTGMMYGENLAADEMLLIVMHSHHTMNISFSATDTADEMKTAMFPTINVVVKNIDNFSLLDPAKNVDCRCAYMGGFYPLMWTELFAEPIIPECVWTNIQKLKPKLPSVQPHAIGVNRSVTFTPDDSFFVGAETGAYDMDMPTFQTYADDFDEDNRRRPPRRMTHER